MSACPLPDWALNLMGAAAAAADSVTAQGRTLRRDGGIWRDDGVAEADQAQTRDMFAFKWSRTDTYASEAMRAPIRRWLRERYAPLLTELAARDGGPASLLDAGCGAGNAAALLLEDRMPGLRYVGVDISRAVDLAAQRIAPLGGEHLFVQADLLALPFRDGAFDVVLSEGVLHHTPSTRSALLATARLVRPGGLFAIYVYARKSPVREFTDDLIRDRVAAMTPEQAWEALEPLTRLGEALGRLGVVVDVPEDVPLLGVPKGPIDIQRLFYWHVCKAFYRPDWTLDEMNHVNFDWFTPRYCHRQTPDDVQLWCKEAGLVIEHLIVEESGITVLARRPTAG
jgi:SAM-dependent methyltransferase